MTGTPVPTPPLIIDVALMPFESFSIISYIISTNVILFTSQNIIKRIFK